MVVQEVMHWTILASIVLKLTCNLMVTTNLQKDITCELVSLTGAGAQMWLLSDRARLPVPPRLQALC